MRTTGSTIPSRIVLVLAALMIAFFAVGCGSSDEDVQTAVNEALAKEKQKETQKKLVAEQKRLKREMRKLKRQRSGSSSSGGSTASSASCGRGVSRNSVTTCPFALNVAYKYRRYGSGSIKAWSPALSRYVYMNCSGGSPAVCTGGNGAQVTIR